MGTKLGDLHVLGASVEEVAALLPGAVVGRWSERFVSAYCEDYQWGTVEREGKKLSRKLPDAVVLSAALFDDDVVSFELFQAGKRLTGHLLNPYEDRNVMGKVGLFCEALGLPTEDEKRLRVLWKKGDACEQMELTGLLLGAPLWADPERLPKEAARRDTAAVDAWIAQRPDPPKIRNATKAVLLQEEGGLGLARDTRELGGTAYFHFTKAVEDGWCMNDGWLYRCTPEGPLERWERARWPVEEDGSPDRWNLIGEALCYGIGPDRVLGYRAQFEPTGPGSWTGAGVRILWDSAGRLTLPLYIENPQRIRSLPDGGIGAVCAVRKEQDWDCDLILRKYAPEGDILGEKKLPERVPEGWGWQEDGFFMTDGRGELAFWDWEGNETFRWEKTPGRCCGRLGGDFLFLQEEKGRFYVSRMDRKGQVLRRSQALPETWPGQAQVRLSDDGKHVFVSVYEKGLYLLDGESLALLWSQQRKGYVGFLETDGAGRTWLQVDDSTVEGYDRDWSLVSRHRLKGWIIDARLDGWGRLLVVTHHYNKSIARVYRIS